MPSRADTLRLALALVCPASTSLPCVVSVSADEGCAWNEYLYKQGNEVEFGAHPWPRSLPGTAQSENLRGHSMATAHVSALVARIMEAYPGVGPDEVRRFLIRECVRTASGSSVR